MNTTFEVHYTLMNHYLQEADLVLKRAERTLSTSKRTAIRVPAIQGFMVQTKGRVLDILQKAQGHLEHVAVEEPAMRFPMRVYIAELSRRAMRVSVTTDRAL